MENFFLPRERLQVLIDALRARGFRCFGPQVRDAAIVYADLDSAAQLPAGVRVEQAPGTYRMTSGAFARQFAWANGPQALKPLLFAPRETLWRARRGANGGIEFQEQIEEPAPVAIIGARACDLAALALQDAHFLEQEQIDAWYAARRRNLFVVAVECSHPAATCFCASTGDGPQVKQGSDITLIELDEGFVAWHDSERGRDVLAVLDLGAATAEQAEAAHAQTDAAASAQTRGLPSRNLRNALLARLDHPRWTPRVLAAGKVFAVAIAGGFIVIALWAHFAGARL